MVELKRDKTTYRWLRAGETGDIDPDLIPDRILADAAKAEQAHLARGASSPIGFVILVDGTVMAVS